MKDVVIVGGGPSGLSLALLLCKADFDVVVIDKNDEKSLQNPDYDGREIALTHPSIDLLKEIEVWDLIDEKYKSQIDGAKVLNGFSSYSLDFDKPEGFTGPLGYFVSNNKIRKALYEKAVAQNIKIITSQMVEDVEIGEKTAKVILSNEQVFETKLIAAADSRFSKLRNKMGISSDMHDFARTMIVCKMKLEKDHDNIALECFYDDRVLAILPTKGKNCSLVMTLPTKIAQEKLEISKQEFNAEVTRYFEDRYGKMTLDGKLHPYPLMAVYANDFCANRLVLTGDAAVGMHPVTAHGFNLGLLGQRELTKQLMKARLDGLDLGSKEVLKKYEANHKKETRIMYHGTNSLVSIFTNNKLPARILRSLMLKTANSKFLPFKSIISNRLTGSKNLGLVSLLGIK